MALITLGTNSGKGKILQVVSATNTGSTTNSTSTTYVDTSTTITYTPLLSNSKIFVTASESIGITVGTGNQRADLRLFESVTSTEISKRAYIGVDGTGNGGRVNIPFTLSGVFTNSTASEKTFKVQVRKANATASENGGMILSWHPPSVHEITLMEIAG